MSQQHRAISSRSKRRLRVALRPACVLLVALLTAVLSACTETEVVQSPREQLGIVVVPHQVRYREDQLIVEAVGTARARRTAMIYAETGGEVTHVRFGSGSRVAQADVILELEARQERLAVTRAQVAVKDAEQLLARYQRIDVPGAISDSQIDEAKTALEAARIELEIAQNALSERTVRAPFSGHLGLSNIDAGTRITPALEITRLDDRAELFIDFEAPEQVFGRFDEGDQIAMVPFADPASTYQAEVLAFNSSIDPVSRAFTVRTRIDNANDALRPGMSFKLSFAIDGGRYPAVPEAAIVWGGDGAYLWGIEEGLAKRVPATIISRSSGQVLVKAEIPEGAIIIAQGVQKVRENSPVVFSPAMGALAPGGR